MPAQMAEAYVRLAVAPECETVTGRYFDEKCREVNAYKPAYDQAVWKKLRAVSVTLSHLDAEPASV